MTMTRILLFAAAASLLSGCTYMETRSKVSSGYYDSRYNTAKQNYENELDKKTQLERDQRRVEDERISVERDLARYEQQLAALNSDLKQAQTELEAARKKNQLSRTEYEKLQAELDQIRFEENAQQYSKADPAEKQRKLEELQQRREALQKAIEALASS
jgi:chromosome segregation ATPase